MPDQITHSTFAALLLLLLSQRALHPAQQWFSGCSSNTGMLRQRQAYYNPASSCSCLAAGQTERWRHQHALLPPLFPSWCQLSASASSALRLLLEVVHGEVGGEGGDGAEAVNERLHLALQPGAAGAGTGGSSRWGRSGLRARLSLIVQCANRHVHRQACTACGQLNRHLPHKSVGSPTHGTSHPPRASHPAPHLSSVGTSTMRLSRSMRKTRCPSPSACCGRSTNWAFMSRAPGSEAISRRKPNRM